MSRSPCVLNLSLAHPSFARFINTHIRADKKNQLLLRTEMRPSDIQIIRDVGADSDGIAARLLKAKMAREHIFRPLMVGEDFAAKVPLV